VVRFPLENPPHPHPTPPHPSSHTLLFPVGLRQTAFQLISFLGSLSVLLGFSSCCTSTVPAARAHVVFFPSTALALKGLDRLFLPPLLSAAFCALPCSPPGSAPYLFICRRTACFLSVFFTFRSSTSAYSCGVHRSPIRFLLHALLLLVSLRYSSVPPLFPLILLVPSKLADFIPDQFRQVVFLRKSGPPVPSPDPPMFSQGH